MYLYFFLIFCLSPGDSQGLVLAVDSGIILGGLKKLYEVLGIETWFATYKASTLSIVLLFQLNFLKILTTLAFFLATQS